MTGGRLDFNFQLGKAATGHRSSGDRPMRILVLADLRGNGEQTVPLAVRTPLAINVDNAEHVLARLAPRLSLVLESPEGGKELIELEFRQIDDFHPDALFRHADAFAGFRHLREELGNPTSFARAAAALGASSGLGTTAPAPPSRIVEESNADTIERLLGRAPAQLPSPDLGVVDHLLREAVAPHVVQDHAVAQTQALASLDAMIAERMRRILRQPLFQRLEATWRGVWKLATELETGDALQISVLDMSRDELQADLQAHAEDLSEATLYRVLCGPESAAEEGGRWSMLVGDFTFGPDVGDVSALAALGALAARAGAPFLASAGPRLVGCANPEELGAPSQWLTQGGETASLWKVFRQSLAAEWVGLALPRLLTRLPYGSKTDPIESFAFEEMADGRGHEHYLWGNPAYALGFLAGQAFSEQGWEMDVAARLEIEDLPSHVYRDGDDELKQQPCAEVWLSEVAAEAILDWGVMPILSYRNRNAARLLRWQSVSLPSRALAGMFSA